MAGVILAGLSMKKGSTFILLLLGMSISFAAFACPVCFSAKGATASAFRWSTLFLSLIPFIAFGSFFYWFRAQLKNRNL